MAHPPQRPLNPSLYSWHRTPSPQPTYTRRLLAGEIPWLARPKTQHEILVYASLSLSKSHRQLQIRRAAIAAWRTLRWQVPELGSVAAWLPSEGDGEEEACLIYRTPSLDVELRSNSVGDQGVWNAKLPIFLSTESPSGFEALRASLLDFKTKFEKATKENGLLLLNIVEPTTKNGENLDTTKIEIVLNIDHQISDGIGSKVLMGRYLEIFGQKLESELEEGEEEEDEDLNWEDSWKNLELPWIQRMNSEQVFSGEEYERDCEEVRDLFYNRLVCFLSLLHTFSNSQFSTPKSEEKKIRERILTSTPSPKTPASPSSPPSVIPHSHQHNNNKPTPSH